MTPDTSIILKGLISLLNPSANWLGKRILGKEILERRQLLETALQPVLKKATEYVAETIEQIGEAEIHQICLFLTSNESEAIIRQIYAASILEIKEQNLEQIQQEFLKAFSLYTNIPEDKLKDSAPKIFNTLVAGCEEALRVAIDRGRLSAHEAKSVFRHQVLLDELRNVKKILKFLIESQKLDIRAIFKFEEKYRQQVIVRYKNITPPYIHESRKIPIDEIYIDSYFLSENRTDELDLRRKINYKVLSQEIERTVILGNPGSGKSTFAQKLTYDLADNYEQRLLSSRKVTPILVILRDYGAKKKNQNFSILQFIESTFNTKYQLQSPPGALEYLLLNGRVAVIFDGLDELTDTSYRQEISSNVECFCNLYPSVPVLVTSRQVGYQEAPLDEQIFKVYYLAAFDDQQVKEYVSKWFAVDRDLTEEKQKQNVTAFLEESKTLTDLRSNPLMLGLMCNIYRGEGYIPRNRPDVYKKCANMMFESWDKRRHILPSESIQNIESKVSPTMMYLANWIYSDQSLQEGVTEEKLINEATNYLIKRIEDYDEAEDKARNIVSFCRGRAWVFTDTGTTKDGEKIYQFTHRTFLEYFTAAYLNRTNNTPEKLFNVLLPKIAKQEWDVVSQLAFQIQNNKYEDAGDELLTFLINEANKTDNFEKWNLLSFAIRCLEFIVPSSKVLKNIVNSHLESCVKFCLKILEENVNKNVSKVSNQFRSKSRSHTPYTIIMCLNNANYENHKIIVNTVKDFLIKNIESNEESRIYISIEIFQIIKKYFDGSVILNDLQNDTDILKLYENQLNNLASKFLPICILAVKEKKLPISEMIRLHGCQSIFQDYIYIISVFPPARTIDSSIAKSLLNHYINVFSKQDVSKYELSELSELSELGESLLSEKFPLINNLKKEDYQQNHLRFLLSNLSSKKAENKNNLNKNRIDASTVFNSNNHFGFCLLVLIYIEIDTILLKSNIQTYANLIMQSKHILFDFTRYIFSARYRKLGEYDDEIEKELTKCNFNQEQRDFIWRWVRKEINLVETTEE
ncbi:MAG: NACHT domain-containing protein [Moorea sp. SIO2B7]|nr:NACHT domain-containing protein [Moorena sp. SIO2B7]